MKTMKRLLSCLLVLCLLLSVSVVLTGCDGEKKNDTGAQNGNSHTDNGGEKEPEKVVTSLLEGAKNLQAASSYRFQVVNKMKSGEYAFEETKEYLVVKAADGTATILIRSSADKSHDDVTYSDEATFYYEGKEGYEWDDANNVTNKTVSDTPFTLAGVLEEEEDIVVRYDEQSVLALFDGMNPTATEEENGLLLEAKDMTEDQWKTLYMAMASDSTPVEEIQSISLTSYTFNGRLTKDGHLQEVTIGLSMERDGEKVNNSITFAIDQINATTVEKPDYVKNFQLEPGTQIVYIEKGQDVHYAVLWGEEENTITFVGFGDGTDGLDHVVEQYTVLTEVEGLPVTAITDVMFFSYSSTPHMQVKRLVIPAGIRMEGVVHEERNTVLFFEDAEADVYSDEFVKEKAEANFEGIYYAGQWEYVDGIATPVN